MNYRISRDCSPPSLIRQAATGIHSRADRSLTCVGNGRSRGMAATRRTGRQAQDPAHMVGSSGTRPPTVLPAMRRTPIYATMRS
jgi:hypothetical protein